MIKFVKRWRYTIAMALFCTFLVVWTFVLNYQK